MNPPLSPGSGRGSRRTRSTFPPSTADYGMPDDEQTTSSEVSDSSSEGEEIPWTLNTNDEGAPILLSITGISVGSTPIASDTGISEYTVNMPFENIVSTMIADEMESEIVAEVNGSRSSLDMTEVQITPNQSDLGVSRDPYDVERSPRFSVDGEKSDAKMYLHLVPRNNDEISLHNRVPFSSQKNWGLNGVSRRQCLDGFSLTASPSNDFETIDDSSHELILSSTPRSDAEAEELLQSVLQGTSNIGFGPTLGPTYTAALNKLGKDMLDNIEVSPSTSVSNTDVSYNNKQ